MLLVAVLALAGVVGATALLLVPEREVDRLQLVLAPHPDDEVLALPLLDEAPGTHTVVVSLTRGEATSRCADIGRYLQEDLGERAPEPIPTGPQDCAAARANSWAAFLDAAPAITRELRLGPGSTVVQREVTDERLGGRADVTGGRDTTRVMLSLPDEGLTPESTLAAVQGVLDLRGDVLPDLPVQRVVVAAYSRPAGNGDDVDAGGGSLVYGHPDHAAVTAASTDLAALTGADVWVNVPPDSTPVLGPEDADSAPERVSVALSVEDYEGYLALGPARDPREAERIGLVQVAYGWLSFPGRVWSAGERPSEDDGVLFARVQDFLIVPAP